MQIICIGNVSSRDLAFCTRCDAILCLSSVCPLFVSSVCSLSNLISLLLLSSSSSFFFFLLFQGYRKERFWWESVVAIRKAAVTLLAVFGTTLKIEMQTYIAILLLFSFLFIHLTFRPYGMDIEHHRMLHNMESMGLSVCFITMWSGLMFYSYSDSELIQPYVSNILIAVSIFLVIINVGYITWMGYAFGKEFVMELKNLMRESRISRTATVPKEQLELMKFMKQKREDERTASIAHDIMAAAESSAQTATLAKKKRMSQSKNRLRERIAAKQKLRKSRVMQRVKIFSELSDDALSKIIEMMSCESISKHTIIVKEGDPSLAFYVIMKGICAVQNQGYTIARLSTLDFFGETSLSIPAYKDAPTPIPRRGADVVSMNEPVQIMVLYTRDLLRLIDNNTIDRSTIRQVASKSDMKTKRKMQTILWKRATKKISENSTLKKVAAFSHLSDDSIATIVAAMEFKEYKKNDVLCRQGAVADRFFVIVEGTCIVTVRRPEHGQSRTSSTKTDDPEDDDRSASEEDLENQFRVGTLKDQQFFGEASILSASSFTQNGVVGDFQKTSVGNTGGIRAATVRVASDKVQVLCLGADDLQKLIQDNVIGQNSLATVAFINTERQLANRNRLESGEEAV